MSPAIVSACRHRQSIDLITKESRMVTPHAQAGDKRLQHCHQLNILTANAIKAQMQQVLAGGASLEIDLARLLAGNAHRQSAQG